MKRFFFPLALFSALLVITLLIRMTGLDLSLATLFFRPGQKGVVVLSWMGMTHPFWQTVYKVAAWPAALLGVSALLVLALGSWLDPLRLWRRSALFYLLFLALGSGLLVNVLLKDSLGKPRPYEIVEFGGQYPHAEFWEKGTGKENGSFPSGHASIAFALMGPWFVFRRRHALAARAFLVAGLSWGALVGLGRMAQGGHFFSDVLWAGGLMYLTGEILAFCLSLDGPPRT